MSLIALVLISVIFKNYKPVSGPVLNQDQKINSEEQQEINTNNMEENNATSTNATSTNTSATTTVKTEQKVERVVKSGDTASVNYIGTLQDGTKFDSSYDRGVPIEFVVGIGRVIKGWDQGLLGMQVGEKKHLVLPPDLAYGAAGVTLPHGTVVIPSNATLIFDIELVSIK